jgi:glucose/arabinose dehydrogenase
MATRTLAILVLMGLPACGSSGSGGTPTSQNSNGGPDNPFATDQTRLCRGIALPDDQAFVADGLCVRAVALEQGSLRQLTFSAAGDLIGVTSQGAIVRYRDVNEDGIFSGGAEIKTIAHTGGKNGSNAVFDADETYLYAGSPAGVVRFRYSASDNLGPAEAVVVGEPSSGTHQLHTVKIYDGFLYVHSGSEMNAAEPDSPSYDTERAVLKRFPLDDFQGKAFDWSEGELYFSGIRNMVGFTQNPSDAALYGVVNGLDDLVYQGEDVHLENPGEDLIRLDQGKSHGYPYCFTAAKLEVDGSMMTAGTQLAGTVKTQAGDPDFVNPHDDAWCKEHSTEPLTFMAAHSAPLDVLFVSGATALPATWEGSALVALHGSWDTSPSVGHQVVRVPFGSDGTTPMPKADASGMTFYHDVIFGGVGGDGAWGWASGSDGEYPVRPTGLAISPVDGALYVASDNASTYMGTPAPNQGAIYRIAKRDAP